MARRSETVLQGEMRRPVVSKNRPQVLAPKTVLILAVLFLAGLSGAVSPPTSAQQATDLSRIVVVGDSLSAGFQNDSLLDTQQPNGWASLLATQANVPLVLPLIGPPGIPNVLELITSEPSPILEPAPGPPSLGRDDPYVQATDLAVPGAELEDALTTRPSLPIDDFTGWVLGLPGLNQGVSRSQVEWAETLRPTTVFVWIGNNDILGAAAEANPSSATALSNFLSNYDQLLSRLAATGATLVVANIPDVTVVPFFTPTSEIDEEIGLPPVLTDLILGIGPNDYVLPEGVALIPKILVNPSLGPIPSQDILRASQVLQVRLIISAYNAIIANRASAHGAVLVDIYSLTNQIRSQGIQANGLRLTNAYLGGLFSLDGVHPTNTGYAVIANQFITTLNRTRGTAIPLVDINQVASNDPLVFGEATPPASLERHVTPAIAGAVRPLLLNKQPHH